MDPTKSGSWFTTFAKWTAAKSGRPATFCTAFFIVIGWAVCGPIFNYSDTWQLVINTSTTIITFLMVFLIQNTQNRDSVAIQVKLDEIIRSIEGGKNELMDLEELEESELSKIRDEYEALAAKARKSSRKKNKPTAA